MSPYSCRAAGQGLGVSGLPPPPSAAISVRITRPEYDVP